MANPQFFNFLGTFWDNLPAEDRQRMGEFWHGSEQVFASVYQKFVEVDLNLSIDTLLPYNTERWLKYNFTTPIARPAIFTSSQDISLGVNMASKYLMKFSIDGGAPIEVNVQGANPLTTTIDEIIAAINAAAGFQFARAIFQNTIIQLASSTIGPTSSIEILPASDISKDVSEFVLGVQISDMPLKVPEYPFTYAVPYSKVAKLPMLQDHIRDESVTMRLVQGVDYDLESGSVIKFKTAQNGDLWAKRTFFDEETPWNNFGFLIDIYQKNTPSYLSVVQGLWFAFWNGPKPENLKIALYLLFGLPTAKEDAIVTSVTGTNIETTSKDGFTRNFEIPSQLTAIVSVGDSVKRFQPLVSGIDVFDKINAPGFVTTEIGRAGIQRFLTEQASRGPGDTDETKALTMLEEHTFLPQISVDAFISPDIDLGNVKTFLNNIKPLNKTFMFQVIVGTFRDPVAIDDMMGMDITIDVTPNLDSNQTTFIDEASLDAYETVDAAEMNLDSDGVAFQEEVEVIVYQNNVQIDDFIA